MTLRLQSPSVQKSDKQFCPASAAIFSASRRRLIAMLTRIPRTTNDLTTQIARGISAVFGLASARGVIELVVRCVRETPQMITLITPASQLELYLSNALYPAALRHICSIGHMILVG